MLEAPAVPELKAKEFAQIRALAYDMCGLDLRQGRERLVSARLSKHLRAGRFKSFEEYLNHVRTDRSGEAAIALINALTTNHTSFLREPDHFDFLVKQALPSLRPGSTASIWSAACSTGEEPYSILFSSLEAAAPAGRLNVQLTATDISTKVLAQAREGIYAADRLAGAPPVWLAKYFENKQTASGAQFQVRLEFRNRITFRRYNLMDPVPPGPKQHVVFCRNVMIYFNRETQSRVINRLAACIQPGGYLFVGHAESLTGIDHPLRYVRPAIYQRPA